MQELPLVIFTTLTQGVVGAFILLTIFMLFQGIEKAHQSIFQVSTLIGLWSILGVGGLAAIAHLGSPLRAFNVMNGLAHYSALSIEILVVSIFGMLGVTSTFLLWKKFNPTLTKILFVITSISAVTVVIAIAQVYQLPTVPYWRSNWTTITFFCTALNLGCGFFFAASHYFKDGAEVRLGQLKKLFISIVFIALTFTVLSTLGNLFWLSEILQNMGLTLPTRIQLFMIAKVTLSIIGLSLLLIYSSQQQSRLSSSIALLLILLGELSGRIAFYELITVHSL